jgi:hypothetical protein
MATLIQSGFLDAPINIDEILEYNRDGFDKTHLTLTILAKDEVGASNEVEERVPLYIVGNLAMSGNGTEFTWDFRNFSKVNIRMEIEIINSKREVINRGKTFEKGFNYDTINLSDKLTFIEYPDDQYYYRIRVFCPSEGWDSYYPTREGILFQLDRDWKQLREKTINGDIRYVHKWLMDNPEIQNPIGLIDPGYVKKLIDLMCNPVNNKVYKLTSGTRGKYTVAKKFDSYSEENSFGLHDTKMEFTIDDEENFIANRHQLNAYVDGKKVFWRDNNTQQKLDGISRSFLKEGDISDNAKVELETVAKYLIDAERFMVKYLLQTEEDVQKIYTTGIEIPCNELGSYYTPRDFSIYVRFKNSNSWKRVNPIRTKLAINFLGEDKFSFTVLVKDNYIPKIGNEIMIVHNEVVNAMFYKTDAFNKMANYYQVPCYFVPVSHVTSNGEVITEFMDEIKNIEVFVNGYRLVPNVDFALINILLHTQIPSILLFKDMTHFGSKIEVIYHDHRDNTYFFFSQIADRADGRAVITLQDEDPPFIRGTFTIFANNKKLSDDQFDVINSRSIILKDTGTRKNIMIKFHHNEDELLIRLLEILRINPPFEDFRAKQIGQDVYVNDWIASNETYPVTESDEDYYVGLKYIYQLDERYNYFEQMYDMIKDNIVIDLDANNTNLFTNLKVNPVALDQLPNKLPMYFNHDVSVNMNRSYNEHRYEDNVALFNPGRSYLIHATVDRHFDKEMDCDFDCNVEDSVEFLTYLNENIPLILPYLNNNILIDCNEPYDKANYKGLK